MVPMKSNINDIRAVMEAFLDDSVHTPNDPEPNDYSILAIIDKLLPDKTELKPSEIRKIFNEVKSRAIPESMADHFDWLVKNPDAEFYIEQAWLDKRHESDTIHKAVTPILKRLILAGIHVYVEEVFETIFGSIISWGIAHFIETFKYKEQPYDPDEIKVCAVLEEVLSAGHKDRIEERVIEELLKTTSIKAWAKQVEESNRDIIKEALLEKGYIRNEDVFKDFVSVIVRNALPFTWIYY